MITLDLLSYVFLSWQSKFLLCPGSALWCMSLTSSEPPSGSPSWSGMGSQSWWVCLGARLPAVFFIWSRRYAKIMSLFILYLIVHITKFKLTWRANESLYICSVFKCFQTSYTFLLVKFILIENWSTEFLSLKGLSGRAHKKLRFKPGLVFIDGKYVFCKWHIFLNLTVLLY